MTQNNYQAICSKALAQVKEDSDGPLYNFRGYIKYELRRVLNSYFHTGQIKVLGVLDLLLGQVLAFAKKYFGLAVVMAKVLVPILLALCSPLLPSSRVDRKASCMALLLPLLFLQDTILLL